MTTFVSKPHLTPDAPPAFPVFAPGNGPGTFAAVTPDGEEVTLRALNNVEIVDHMLLGVRVYVPVRVYGDKPVPHDWAYKRVQQPGLENLFDDGPDDTYYVPALIRPVRVEEIDWTA